MVLERAPSSRARRSIASIGQRPSLERLPHFIACARVVATTDRITATSERLYAAVEAARG